ncbi:Maestro Heat-Like Repeat-Containing Protein Family Member 9 [Manis pentadactyla]|nr:Maestro Heat-Like Repeat-Containing Protein Family Member 9 [Manis pentadactyla]
MASCLLDIYSDLLDHQAIILAVNSSFVDPLLQFESQLKIIEKSFKMVFSVPNLDEVKDRGNSQKAREDLETLYCNILNIYEATLLILVSEDLYKLQILKIIGQSLQPSLLTDFVWTLLMTLSTADGSTASKAATLLQLTLEHHTHKVTAVSKIVDAIYKQLCRNSSHVVKDAMLRIITLLTRTYPKMVIFQLMDCPVPADQ